MKDLIQELVMSCADKGFAVSISAGWSDILIELCNDTAYCIEVELNTLDGEEEAKQLQATIDKVRSL